MVIDSSALVAILLGEAEAQRFAEANSADATRLVGAPTLLEASAGGAPSVLNFGDCLSYGLAMALGEPLLFKGDDFSRTDITEAAY